ncbi:alpha/beta hydrolase [Ferrovibrio xuzhouensis]|uniref:Alpha/beta hydrolase n=1 Tax=Ferrovibrio xuzhouensis TaxID=1576914 RepID=A0ABV7VLN1_9PROT
MTRPGLFRIAGWRLLPLVALLLALQLGACAPRLQPPGDAALPPALDTAAGDWRADDGRVLPLRSWLPDGKPKAVILALHGFNDYGMAFADPGAWWAQRGIATFAPDQRGFGAGPYHGYWPGGQRMADDVGDLTRLLRKRYPGVPLYWLGESMGGAVALAAWQDETDHPDGLVLSAPAVWGRASMPLLYRASLWLASYTIPWKTFTGQGLDIQASDNIPMLIRLGRDPLVIKATRVDTIHGLVNLMDMASTVRPQGVPLLLLYGAKDEVIPRPPVERFAEALQAARPSGLQIAVYGNGWHMLLRDLEGKTVWRDIAAWIADPALAALPSGAGRKALPLFAGAVPAR